MSEKQHESASFHSYIRSPSVAKVVSAGPAGPVQNIRKTTQ